MSETGDKTGSATTVAKPDFIKLISSDNVEFLVERRAAMASRFIRNLMQSGELVLCAF